MRLAVAVILISLCVPPLAQMAEDYQDGTCENEVQSQIEIIEGASDMVYYSGVGSSVTVSVAIPAGYGIKVGGNGADMYCLTVLKGDVEVSRTYMEHPSVRFLNNGTVLCGICDLVITCSDDGTYGVEVDCL